MSKSEGNWIRSQLQMNLMTKIKKMSFNIGVKYVRHAFVRKCNESELQLWIEQGGLGVKCYTHFNGI